MEENTLFWHSAQGCVNHLTPASAEFLKAVEKEQLRVTATTHDPNHSYIHPRGTNSFSVCNDKGQETTRKHVATWTLKRFIITRN